MNQYSVLIKFGPQANGYFSQSNSGVTVSYPYYALFPLWSCGDATLLSSHSVQFGAASRASRLTTWKCSASGGSGRSYSIHITHHAGKLAEKCSIISESRPLRNRLHLDWNDVKTIFHQIIIRILAKNCLTAGKTLKNFFLWKSIEKLTSSIEDNLVVIWA